MSHNPDHVPTVEKAIMDLFGGTKHGRSDYLLNLTCAHGKVLYDEIERLRRIEAAAKAWLDIDTVFDSDHTVELETVEAREALRKAIGGE